MDGSHQLPDRVYGRIRGEGGTQAGLHVVLRTAAGTAIGEAHTETGGAFDIRPLPAGEEGPLELAVLGADVEPVPIPASIPVHEVEIELPRGGGDEGLAWVGGYRVDAEALAGLRHGGAEVLADALDRIAEPVSFTDRVRVLVAVLKPRPDDLLDRDDCETPLYRWLDAVAMELGEWVTDWLGPGPGPGLETMAQHVCGPFRIYYSTDVGGPDSQGPNPHVSLTPITLPGTAFVLGYTAPHGPPNFIQRVCFWLSFARQRFTTLGSFREPLGGGEIKVIISTAFSTGAAFGGILHLNRGLSDDALARYAVHEYMHLIQEEYEGVGGVGSWLRGREGGSVLAEELVLPAVNANVEYANSPVGSLAAPSIPLGDHLHELCLLLLYLAEQHPRGGAAFYRGWLELFGAKGYDPAMLPATFAYLWPTPPSHGVRHFGAAWPARDTLLGNFWLACALKDLGPSPSDPRFGFAGNAEFALLDKRVRYTRMRPVEVRGESPVSSNRRLVFSNVEVASYAACFFRFEMPSSIDHVRLEFAALGDFTRPLVQVAVIEPGHRVREVVRTADPAWVEVFASQQDGLRMHHLWVVVAAAETAGRFRLSIEKA